MRANQHRRATWGDLVVGLVILIAAVFLVLCLFSRDKSAVTAQVTLDGQVLLSCRLEELEEPLNVPVDGEHRLVLELSADGVRVLEAQCPGEDCAHMGTITRAGEQIVCLPNRLVVTLQGEGANYDAMTG